jgi:hypothetical protein
MITHVDEWVNLLTRLKISPNQFLICWLVYEKDMASTIKYYQENPKNRFSIEDIEYLVENDFLLRLSKDKNNNNLDYFMTTPKFTENLIVDEDDAGDEIWDAYPSWLMVNNHKVSAKSCDKDDLKRKYSLKIKGSMKKHLQIMATLKEYVNRNNGLATMGIEKFVGSEQWNVLEEAYKETPDGSDLMQNL